ncbi:unnamed protein product [Amoebophrya sp. A25]|nr:unnamed protein product [Amoebophrya sp. A25]|eukprot:GSA25T00022989001.1
MGVACKRVSSQQGPQQMVELELVVPTKPGSAPARAGHMKSTFSSRSTAVPSVMSSSACDDGRLSAVSSASSSVSPVDHQQLNADLPQNNLLLDGIDENRPRFTAFLEGTGRRDQDAPGAPLPPLGEHREPGVDQLLINHDDPLLLQQQQNLPAAARASIDSTSTSTGSLALRCSTAARWSPVSALTSPTWLGNRESMASGLGTGLSSGGELALVPHPDSAVSTSTLHPLSSQTQQRAQHPAQHPLQQTQHSQHLQLLAPPPGSYGGPARGRETTLKSPTEFMRMPLLEEHPSEALTASGTAEERSSSSSSPTKENQDALMSTILNVGDDAAAGETGTVNGSATTSSSTSLSSTGRTSSAVVADTTSILPSPVNPTTRFTTVTGPGELSASLSSTASSHQSSCVVDDGRDQSFPSCVQRILRLKHDVDLPAAVGSLSGEEHEGNSSPMDDEDVGVQLRQMSPVLEQDEAEEQHNLNGRSSSKTSSIRTASPPGLSPLGSGANDQELSASQKTMRSSAGRSPSPPSSSGKSSVTTLPPRPQRAAGSSNHSSTHAGASSASTVMNRRRSSSTMKKIPAQGVLDRKLLPEGANLSVGERQLLCLARVLLRNPELLICDEATASVDLETDKKVQAALKTWLRTRQNCCVLTIAHRLDTIADYEKVMVLDKGNVVEFGTIPELMRKEVGHFRAMTQAAPEPATRMLFQQRAGEHEW